MMFCYEAFSTSRAPHSMCMCTCVCGALQNVFELMYFSETCVLVKYRCRACSHSEGCNTDRHSGEPVGDLLLVHRRLSLPVWADWWNMKPEEGSNFHTICEMLPTPWIYPRISREQDSEEGNIRCCFLFFLPFFLLFSPQSSKKTLPVRYIWGSCSPAAVSLSDRQPDRRPPASSGLPVETRNCSGGELAAQSAEPGSDPRNKRWSVKYYELPLLMQRQQLKIANVIFRQHLWDLLRGASGLGRAEPPVPALVTGASHKYTARPNCKLQLVLSELSVPDRSDEHTVIYLAAQHGRVPSRKGVRVKSMLCPYLPQCDSTRSGTWSESFRPVKKSITVKF